MEKAIPTDKISSMDEAFLTGTTTQIASISKLGEHTYQTFGAIGPNTYKLQEAFAKLKELDSSTLIL